MQLIILLDQLGTLGILTGSFQLNVSLPQALSTYTKDYIGTILKFCFPTAPLLCFCSVCCCWAANPLKREGGRYVFTNFYNFIQTVHLYLDKNHTYQNRNVGYILISTLIYTLVFSESGRKERRIFLYHQLKKNILNCVFVYKMTTMECQFLGFLCKISISWQLKP